MSFVHHEPPIGSLSSPGLQHIYQVTCLISANLLLNSMKLSSISGLSHIYRVTRLIRQWRISWSSRVNLSVNQFYSSELNTVCLCLRHLSIYFYRSMCPDLHALYNEGSVGFISWAQNPTIEEKAQGEASLRVLTVASLSNFLQVRHVIDSRTITRTANDTINIGRNMLLDTFSIYSPLTSASTFVQKRLSIQVNYT